MLQSNSASCALSEIHKAEDLPGAGANESQSRRLGYSQPIDVKRFTEASHCSVSYLLEQSLCSAPIVLFPVSTGVQNNMLVVPSLIECVIFLYVTSMMLYGM